jgi:hypothetical protein
MEINPEDFVAVGVVSLALGAVFVALIVAIGLVLGKVSGREASRIIISCVGGTAISSIVAALLRRSKYQGRSKS